MLAVAPASATAERPIVYAVVIDGLDGDRVDEGKAPFISSLLAERATYYDLRRRSRGRTRALLQNSPRTRMRVRLRSARRHRMRVRMRAASGAPGRW